MSAQLPWRAPPAPSITSHPTSIVVTLVLVWPPLARRKIRHIRPMDPRPIPTIAIPASRPRFCRMKTKLATLALLFGLAGASWAAPLSFNEISLLVRLHEPETYIQQQLAQRRLLRALTPEQEAKLKSEG